MNGFTLVLALLLAAPPLLASPQFEQVAECGDLRPLRWQTWLYRDGADGLFTQEAFLPQTEWTAAADDITGGRLVADCFGDPSPHSRDVVVHYYPPAPLVPVMTRPVVLVTGAGDNALRSMSFLAVSLSRAGFHVYAPTFAHRHGDNFLQAEQVANVVALAQARHRGVKVDLVAYSKGGQAARIYVSNLADADWAAVHLAYHEHGTRYRGDVGRLIFVGSPHAGLDTVFRWPAQNLFALQDEPLDAPTSWTTYYPFTSANLLVADDWGPISVFQEGGDHFPGQRQLLADLSDLHGLPGSNPSLGAYAVQQDWFTTYYGGLGFYSYSPGIQAAIDEANDVVGALQARGVHPDVELYLAAGGNPILSVGALGAELLQGFWGDADAAERRMTWEGLVEDWLGGLFPWYAEAFADDLPRLFAGTAFLGEISGPSDGLLFVASALDDSGLTLAGARVAEAHLFQGLNHAELIAAGVLAADFYGDAETAGGLYDERLAAKYSRGENQSVEWMIGILSQPVPDMPVQDPDMGVPEVDAGPDDPDMAAVDPDLGTAPDLGTDPDQAVTEAELGPRPDQGGVTIPDDGVTPPVDAGQPDAARPAVTGERFGGTGCTTRPGRGPAAPWALLLLAPPLVFRRRN
ncbi:MAG: hypothetical protein KC613_15185 [Myxococcales bacterium]|nr:hypothetical protein [Myxococcales bacterium]